MNASSPTSVQIFRPAILPMFAAMCLLGLPIYFALAWFLYGLKAWPAVLGGGAAFLLTVLFCSWLLKLCFPLRLAAEGVHGHSAWGLRRFIRWRDIANVRSFRLMNLQYLRLYPRDQKHPTWIALFLAEPQRFREQVQALAPPGDPLAEFLQSSAPAPTRPV